MLTISQIEAASLATWPALETVADGRWVARFAQGFTGRANSIWSMDPADDHDAANRLSALSRHYGERGLPCIYRVTPLTGRNLFRALNADGWIAEKTSLVLSMPIGKTQGFDGAAHFFAVTDPAFLKAQADLQGFDPRAFESFTAIVGQIRQPACGIVLSADDGTPAASLLCVQSGGIVMFYDVITASHLRGIGLGRRMMATGLSWGAENGASDAALQVQGDNLPAIGLYLAMGFTFRYPYHYRRKSGAHA